MKFLKYFNKSEPDKDYKVIEFIVKLYLLLIQSEDVKEAETQILYRLLKDLASKRNISREYLEGKILDEDDTIESVSKNLSNKLVYIDKVRIILSYFVLSFSDKHLSEIEVIKMLNLAKNFKLNEHEFEEIISSFHYENFELKPFISHNFLSGIENSVFEDYLFFGRSQDCNVSFSSKHVAEKELFVVFLENKIFVFTSGECTAKINGIDLKPRKMYIFPEKGLLTVGKVKFYEDTFKKLNKNQFSHDIIDIEKNKNKLNLINDNNQVSMNVSSGDVYLNKKKVILKKEIRINYDDIVEMSDNQSFTNLQILNERDTIGTELFNPDEIFINKDYEFSTSYVEQNNSVIRFYFENEEIFIDTPLNRDHRIFLNGRVIEKPTKFLLNKDIISINKNNFSLNNFFDLIENPFKIESVNVYDVSHKFKTEKSGLDHLNFDISSKEFVAVMGPSGCGKTTLLKVLGSYIYPSKGTILINEKNFLKNHEFFRQYIGYVPQDDVVFSELSVYENLFYRAKLRTPNINEEVLNKKINSILIQLNLTHKKNSRVGNERENYLSGGERKRLNIAMELLYEPSILLCDEPTSGLSSSDSIQIIKILEDISNQGKIVIASIHQPSSTAFSHFDKILLMDKGGKLVFSGPTRDAFQYFNEELEEIEINRDEIIEKRDLENPDFFFDIMEYPEYNKNDEMSYEQIDQNLVIKRKFQNNYWADKYYQKILFNIIAKGKSHEDVEADNRKLFPKKKLPIISHLKMFKTFLSRDFKVKVRNKTNTILTFLEAPILALVIAFILHTTNFKESYSYFENPNIGVFLFIGIIIFMFLGMSNSIEEILSVRRIFLRERKFNIRILYFLASKFLVISLFSLIQVIIFYAISAVMLEIRGLAFWSILYLFGAGVIGLSIGLICSSFIDSSKAIINLLPLILIPQIIFGGAIIKFEKMNKELFIVKKNPIPEAVQIIPSRWLFEGIYTVYSHENMINKNFERVNLAQKNLNLQRQNGEISTKDFRKKMSKIYAKREEIAGKYPKEKYSNKNIELTVNLMNGKYFNTKKNIFLSGYKHFLNQRFSTYYFNILIILLYIILINIFTYLRLKYYYKDK